MCKLDDLPELTLRGFMNGLNDIFEDIVGGCVDMCHNMPKLDCSGSFGFGSISPTDLCRCSFNRRSGGAGRRLLRQGFSLDKGLAAAGGAAATGAGAVGGAVGGVAKDLGDAVASAKFPSCRCDPPDVTTPSCSVSESGGEPVCAPCDGDYCPSYYGKTQICPMSILEKFMEDVVLRKFRPLLEEVERALAQLGLPPMPSVPSLDLIDLDLPTVALDFMPVFPGLSIEMFNMFNFNLDSPDFPRFPDLGMGLQMPDLGDFSPPTLSPDFAQFSLMLPVIGAFGNGITVQEMPAMKLNSWGEYNTEWDWDTRRRAGPGRSRMPKGAKNSKETGSMASKVHMQLLHYGKSDYTCAKLYEIINVETESIEPYPASLHVEMSVDLPPGDCSDSASDEYAIGLIPCSLFRSGREKTVELPATPFTGIQPLKCKPDTGLQPNLNPAPAPTQPPPPAATPPSTLPPVTPATLPPRPPPAAGSSTVFLVVPGSLADFGAPVLASMKGELATRYSVPAAEVIIEVHSPASA